MLQLNRHFDRMIRLKIHTLGGSMSAYRACGYAGFFTGAILSAAITVYLNLSLWVTVCNVLCAYCMLHLMARAVWILAGSEKMINYHYQIAVTASGYIFLHWRHYTVLPYLDITILGIGAFLFIGRIGCLLVGCCHGKPHHWGVCYSEEHKSAGFTPYLVGVRLFPVQLLESLFVLCIVIIGTAMILGKSYRPGDVLAWYVIVYGVARFLFEFLRGDPDRPYYGEFSEAQWTSVILMSLVALGEFSGNLSSHPWHAGVVFFVVLTMTALFIINKLNKSETYNILFARHIREVAGAVDAATAGNCAHPKVSVACTSLGYRISAGKIERDKGCVQHYAFSHEKGTMSEKAAQTLSDLTLKLKHPGSTAEVVRGGEGVFHLLVRA